MDKEICTVFGEHILMYDKEHSDVNQSVFTCECGFSVVEQEDCGTGA